MSRRGVFPGTFNPPTVAHLAIVEAALDRHGLERVDLVMSYAPLGKEPAERPTLDERLLVLERMARRVGRIGLGVTHTQLIADIATGYDVVIMGADKWAQVNDVAFYEGSAEARDEAVARLPTVAVVPRSGFPVPGALVLDVDSAHFDVSSTLARGGRLDLMVPEAAESGLWA